jgi:hypothetical protein
MAAAWQKAVIHVADTTGSNRCKLALGLEDGLRLLAVSQFHKRNGCCHPKQPLNLLVRLGYLTGEVSLERLLYSGSLGKACF